MELTPGTSMEMRYCTGNPNSAKGLTWRKITIITAPFDKPGYEQGPVVEVDDSGQFKVFYIDRILETRPLSRRGMKYIMAENSLPVEWWQAACVQAAELRNIVSMMRFREFVTMHGEYTYPEYVIAYKRIVTDSSRPPDGIDVDQPEPQEGVPPELEPEPEA
eukprot:COSAG05_NODE_3160_length_2278_cov_4.870124_2_plen_162_part_00